MEFSYLLLEQQENILIVRFNSPRTLNSINTRVLNELEILLTSLESNREISVVIFTGEGRAFIAGADIAEMRDFNSEAAQRFGKLGTSVFQKIEESDKIMIAAINGFALGGGCEFALACDLRVASSYAKFGHPEANLGIIPGFSGTQRLPRVVGIGRAKELILTGRSYDAEEACRIGLVSKVVAPDKLMDDSIAIAKDLASKAPIALNYAKQAINKSLDLELCEGLSLEADLFGKCFDSKDQKEGMDAFLEKRRPVFLKS